MHAVVTSDDQATPENYTPHSTRALGPAEGAATPARPADAAAVALDDGGDGFPEATRDKRVHSRKKGSVGRRGCCGGLHVRVPCKLRKV